MNWEETFERGTIFSEIIDLVMMEKTPQLI